MVGEPASQKYVSTAVLVEMDYQHVLLLRLLVLMVYASARSPYQKMISDMSSCPLLFIGNLITFSSSSNGRTGMLIWWIRHLGGGVSLLKSLIMALLVLY